VAREATKKDRLEESSGDETERLRRLSETATAVCARGVLLVTMRDEFCERTRQNVRNAFRDPAWPDVLYLESFDPGPAEAPEQMNESQ
jgi:hypothetical protein